LIRGNMDRSTDQQIRELAAYKEYDATARQRIHKHVVENAYFQAEHNNNPESLERLRRIAEMEGQGELKAELERQEPESKPRRYSYRRQTERMFLSRGVETLQAQYRELYGTEPPPMKAVGADKDEYIDGLIEAILDKKLAE
jgi:hypothetical protein